MTPTAPKRVVLATHNPGKASELAALVRGWGLACVSAEEASLQERDEVGSDFAEIALGKATAAAEQSGEWALADDSGIVVPAHAEAWGVRTRRWAEARGGYGEAARESALRGDGRRVSARYLCALALASPAGDGFAAVGSREGALVWPGRGDGPGVWPYFELPSGHTLAQLDERERRRVHPRLEAADVLHAELLQLAPESRFWN